MMRSTQRHSLVCSVFCLKRNNMPALQPSEDEDDENDSDDPAADGLDSTFSDADIERVK
jgi:hypothetical protein